MRFVLYTHTFSPHEMPFFKACAELFGEALYVVDVPWRIDPSRKGWSLSDEGLKTVILEEIPPGERRSFMRQILGGDSVLLYGQRRNPYMDVIATTPRVVVYASERWLKSDARYLFGKVRIPIPGIFHFLQGAFLSDVLRYGRLLAKNPRFFYFGQGVHAVGDMAIEKLSSALYEFSDDRCRVYRIGGDEFLLIIDEPGEDEAENIIKSAKDKIAAFNVQDDIHISCAAGMAEGKGMDIRSIVKEADEKMYKNKKQEKAGSNYRKP